MHKIGWKDNYFKSTDISVLGNGCVVSKFPQFYDIIKNKYQILPHPYVGSYEGEKGDKFLKEKMDCGIRKSVKLFVMF